MSSLSPTEPAGTAQAPAPIFYTRPELLSPARHAGKSLAPMLNHRFAEKTNSVPLNGVELALAQRHYPVVFSDEATPFPVVIVGLRNAENLYLDAAGRWEEGVYVPAYVRRYPFIFMTGPDQRQFALCIDAASEFVVEGDGNPLFRGDEPADATRNALAFCTSFQAEYEKTQAFAAALVEHKVLESKSATVGLPQGQALTFGPFRIVDEAKLAALPNAVIADWLRRGWLAWIHAHLLSFANWNTLAIRVRAPS